MIAAFKWLVISLLVASGFRGDVMSIGSMIDIHVHDIYFVLDIQSLLIFLTL